MVRQNIDILINYVTKGAERANAVAKKTNQAITRQQRAYADATKTGRRRRDTIRNNMVANANAGQVMRMNQEVLGRFNKEGRGFNTMGGRMANRFRMMTHGARGFRMELLGVMFFGMAMNRVFMGLIKTSLEWFGITELLSTALGILFLPVAELVLDWALKFLEWVLQLTETEKKMIGWFTLVGIAAGTLLFVIGTLGLGIGSMILAFNFSKVASIIGPAGLEGIGTAAATAGIKLANLAKYAGVGITIFMAVKDLKEEQLAAAIGMATIGVGIYTGNPYLIGLGVFMKLVGDEQFLSDIVALGLKIIDFFLLIGEEIGRIIMAAITPGKKYEMSSDLSGAILKGVAKADVQSMVLNDLGFKLPEVNSNDFIPTLKASEKYLESKGLGDIFITQNNNVTGVSSPNDVKKMLEDNNRKLTAEISRGVKV